MPDVRRERNAKMKIREITNPRHVYDGYFETYFIRPFFHHYCDFRGHESAKSCGLSLIAWLIVTLGVAGILMGQVGLMGPESGFNVMLVVGCVWCALSIVPIIALLVRCGNGEPERQLNPRFLGVDMLMAVSCFLFMVLGLLMMLTTLNSGTLSPNAGMTDEEDTTTFEMEEITEEPIFTYQDEATPQPVEENDSLSVLEDPDAVDPDDSFDPTLAPPEDEAVAPELPDSI